jgi:hypothetical protein
MSILSVLQGFFGIGEEYIKGKQKIKLRGLEAAENLKIKTMESASRWEEMASARSSRFLRWTIALHLFALIDASIYMSLTKHENPMVLFETIEAMPLWVQGLFGTVVGFAFGAAPLKNAGAKVFSVFLNRKKK